MTEYIKREDALKIADEFYDHPIGKSIAKSIFCLPAADVIERKEAIPIDWIWKHTDEFYSASQRHSDAPFSEDAMEDSEYVEAIKAIGVISRLVTSYRFELKGADMRGEDDV